MKERWGRKSVLFRAVIYGFCGVIWLLQAFRGPDMDGWNLALGLIWLTGAAVWLARWCRIARAEEKRDFTINGGNENG